MVVANSTPGYISLCTILSVYPNSQWLMFALQKN